jgi:ABC-type dipeptide/oligopeptide/nickel transport system ATPase component
VQAVILGLFADLRSRLGLGLLLITHNLAVVAAVCDRIAVMHAGSVIEQAATVMLLSQPSHPYTRRLLAAIPRLDPALTAPAGQAQD